MVEKEKPRTIRMTDYLWDRLKEAAAKITLTRSTYIRHIIKKDSDEILKENE
jgi:predicted DNA-binding protein